MLYELFLTKKCYKNNLIDVHINNIKKIIKINDREFSQYEIDDIKFLINMLSNYGPIKNSNWLIDDYLLIGANFYEATKLICIASPKLNNERKCKIYPNHSCTNIETLINNKITLFVSLKEDDKIYQLCYKKKKLNENVIFWKFRIPMKGLIVPSKKELCPNFSENQAEDIKIVVDNILNYLNTSNKKVMIDYDSNYRRTSIIIYCVLAVLLMNKYFPKNIFKVFGEIKDKINLLKNQETKTSIFEKDIIELSETIFKYVQFYVTLSLSIHRKTDLVDYNDINNINIIIVSEKDEEKQLVCQVIRLYIEFYLKNNYFITSENYLNVKN